ncbi:MAG: lipoprotein insertase outer membrane protein LolB [Halomonas subglaciescola]|nr:lipoprotein insertase outer membrane protein LolB [Halomonas subglaciescola]
MRTAFSPTLTRLAAPLAALALLAGCASQAPTDDSGRSRGDWKAQHSDIQNLERWTLVGKAGLRTPNENHSANLDWNQFPYYFRMLISGPFGGGRTVLDGRDGRFSLTNSDGHFEAETPEALMNDQLGWSLPVRDLPYWVRGLPGKRDSYQLETDAFGFPDHLEQNGWEVDYRDWTEVNDLWLPRKLSLTYDDMHVTLVVNRWQTDPDAKSDD